MNSEHALEEARDLVTHPQLHEELCTLCALCVEICPTGSWHLVEGCLVWAGEEACLGCCACAEICPEGAITCSFAIVWEDDPQDAGAPASGGG